jgi:hypothetical protein
MGWSWKPADWPRRDSLNNEPGPHLRCALMGLALRVRFDLCLFVVGILAA